jgi:hypothetical protein
VLERRGGPFKAPQVNLAIGVLETRTCLGWRQTCPAYLSGDRLGDRICLVRHIVAEELG